MKQLFASIFFFLIYTQGISQIDNISLQELSNLAMTARITDIEKAVSKYKYTLIDFKKDTVAGKEYEMYYFKKMDTQTEDHIWCKKELNSKDLTKMIGYEVTFASFDSKIYEQFKSEVESDKESHFVEEKLVGKCFHRIYQGATYDYDFSTCKTRYEGVPAYAIIISWNGFAGLRRQE